MRQKLAVLDRRRGQWAPPKRSNVRRYFGALIDFLLSPYPVLEGAPNGQELTYVPNSLCEPALREILSHDQSNYWQLVGYKGTGKSTTIKGCYGLWNKHSVVRFTGEALVLYCTFNSTDLNADEPTQVSLLALRQVIEGILGAALRVVRAEHAMRGGAPVTPEKFHSFVLDTKPDVLTRYPADDSIEDPTTRELKAWEQSNRLTYLAVRLKYELSQLPTTPTLQHTDKPYGKRQLLLIFDDIEGLIRKEDRNNLPAVLAPLWNCIKNGVSYPAKFLIATRPHTRDELAFNQIMTPQTIDYGTTLTLRGLFQHKAEQYLKHTPDGRELAARQNWEDSYRSLWSLLTPYETPESAEVILALSNRCFRDSLSLLANLLQHVASEHPQLTETKAGGFALPQVAHWPQIPRANLIEIIGKRGYDDFAPDEHVGLVNFLENDPSNEATDFLIPLLVHWAFEHSIRYAEQWPKLIDTEVFVQRLKRALPKHPLLDQITWAVKKSEAAGLLESALDKDDPGRILHHLMPRAELLCQEMSQSSIILALSCHGMFLAEDVLSKLRSVQTEPFLQAVRFCQHMLDFERTLQDYCIDKRSLWEGIYYKNLLSRRAYFGLERTWAIWPTNKSKPTNGASELASLREHIESLENEYGR